MVAVTQRALDEFILAQLPRQGEWGEAAYLWLTDRASQVIELTDGYLEVPPMPTQTHQAISGFFYRLFYAYLTTIGGAVYYAPLRLRVRAGKFREPDLLLVRDAGDPRCQERYWLGADLVLEIVSPDDADRDIVEKRRDYAEAGIPEYWIVNPLDQTITVLRLDGDRYVEHGVFRRGAQATSALLPGFAVGVSAAFDAR
jgi:Uma2 family endonuclease